MKTMEERFWAKVDKGDGLGCWNWTASKYPFGYGCFRTAKATVNDGAHRVSYRMAFGEIPNGLCVCHHCDNPSCVRPDHLFVGTKADNNKDKLRKGRVPCGTEHYDAKLDYAKAEQIRAIHGISLQNIALLFGVAKTTVRQIRDGKTWNKRNTSCMTARVVNGKVRIRRVKG